MQPLCMCKLTSHIFLDSVAEQSCQRFIRPPDVKPLQVCVFCSEVYGGCGWSCLQRSYKHGVTC